MTTSELFNHLIGNFMQLIHEIKACAVVDKDGLIIFSKLQDENTEEDVMGTVTAMFDTFIKRVKTDFGSAEQFLNIMSIDDRKIMFASAGKSAILTVIVELDANDNQLKVLGEHVANKVELILEGEDVDTDIPLIVTGLANSRHGYFPKGDFSAKVIVLGDPMVGKTSLIRRFVDSKFAESYVSTIGVDISRKDIKLSDQSKVSLAIWDIGGQITNMSPYRKRFYQGANHALICLDITREKTFHNIDHWLEDIKSSVDENICLTLIATKMDLPDHEVSIEQIEEKARALGCPYIFTSAKTGSNVLDAFQYVAYKFIEKI